MTSMMLLPSLTLFAVLVMIHTSLSAKILVTGPVGPQFKSHMLDRLTIAEELVSRGHDVHYVVPSRCEMISSIEKRGIKVATYIMPPDVPYFGSNEAENFTTRLAFDFTDGWERLNAEAKDIPVTLLRDCEYMMKDEAFIENLRNIGFDIAIAEPFIPCPCTIVLPKHLGIPFVSIAMFYFPWHLRIPALPSFYPLGVLTTNRNSFNFKDRVGMLLFYLLLESGLLINWDENIVLLEKYTVGVTSWKDLFLESELFITTNDHMLDGHLPLMPNFIRLPGLSCKPSQPLPEELNQLMNSAKDGVVVMTFGSSITQIPEDMVKKFLDAFGQLNQTVIAKLRVPDEWTVPKNVHIRSWLPQNDILGHPNTRLFITHCGNGGQYEALYHGVPMLGIPLFGDQHANAQRIIEKGFGLSLDIHDFTASDLFNNIHEMLSNPKYTLAIRKMAAVLRDEPMNPREKAAFWIEHVIKHGGKHLRSVAMDMPTYQFLMFDIIALVFVILFLFLLLLAFLIACVARKIFSKCLTSKKDKRIKKQ